MADLKYDTETMRKSAQQYRDEAVKMKSLKDKLKKEIADLKSTHWKSEAGDAFQDLYEDAWATNVDKYIAVLNEMASQLDKAANDYDDVTRKLRQIEGISV